MKTVLGYTRQGGRFGVRNHIVVMSTVACANTVVQKIAQQSDAIPVTHTGGCMEFKEDHNQTKLALIRLGQHPNVAGILLVGLGCEQIPLAEVADAIASMGKPVERLVILEQGGTLGAVATGIGLVQKLRDATSQEVRTPLPIDDLVVAVRCGGSDWTTALSGNTAIGVMTDMLVRDGGAVLMAEVTGFPGSEHILAQNAATAEVGLSIMKMVEDIRSDFQARYGQSPEEINPTPGNKAGGISTLVEKSVGNIRKAGNAPVQGILKVGNPIPGPGLWILDSRASGPGVFALGAFAIQGAHVVVFNSGLGNPVGSAVMPVIKLTGNPRTYERLKANIDFNAGAIIDGTMDIHEAGQALYEHVLDVAGGKLTKSEELGHFEFAIPRESTAAKCTTGE